MHNNIVLLVIVFYNIVMKRTIIPTFEPTAFLSSQRPLHGVELAGADEVVKLALDLKSHAEHRLVDACTAEVARKMEGMLLSGLLKDTDPGMHCFVPFGKEDAGFSELPTSPASDILNALVCENQRLPLLDVNILGRRIVEGFNFGSAKYVVPENNSRKSYLLFPHRRTLTKPDK